MSEPPTAGFPTVVLVHGAFADASSWNGVIERLRANGVPVTAPANPLRGIAADSAYIASVLEQIEGPVVAVGHSYGGAVITNAAADAKNVVGLVYVAAFAPDEGETLGAVEAGSKDSVLNSALVPRRYPTADGGTATEFSIDPSKVRDAFAGDVSDLQAAVDRRHTAARRRGGVLRAERAARVEAPAVVGGRRHRRQGC
jgi:pimeloyl-ACP methyl ester carboxylesterase